MTSNSPKWVILTNSDKTLTMLHGGKKKESWLLATFSCVVTFCNIQLIRTSDMIKNFNQVGFPLEKNC